MSSEDLFIEEEVGRDCKSSTYRDMSCEDTSPPWRPDQYFDEEVGRDLSSMHMYIRAVLHFIMPKTILDNVLQYVILITKTDSTYSILVVSMLNILDCYAY